jgi:hypothetical protein
MGKIPPELELKFKEFTQEAVHLPLRGVGFKRSGTKWTRTVGDVLQVVRIQRHSYGEPEILFTVNVMNPADPRADPNTYGIRIGQFLPSGAADVWWTVVKEGLFISYAFTRMAEEGGLLRDLICGQVIPYLCAP